VCCIGFATNSIAPRLSLYNVGVGITTQSSVSNEDTQMMFVRAEATLLYSASVLLRETAFCLLQSQEIEVNPK